MLASVLLHVVPATSEIDILTDLGPWGEGFGGKGDAAETMALDVGDCYCSRV